MKYQFQLLCTALQFYSRIPVPSTLPYSEQRLHAATRYFPLVGLIVGGIGAGVYWLASWMFPDYIALLLSMLATIWVTGSFHEDGFADFCDGFGGGYSIDRILDIMKDSRIGTYGCIGLIGMLTTKFAALYSIHELSFFLVLPAAHTLSRLMPVLVIFSTPYSRKDATSKSKPIGQKGTILDLWIAAISALALLFFLPWDLVGSALLLLLLMTFLFRKYVLRKLGGYTGDCLGALQQLAEVCLYLSMVAYFQLRL